MNIKKIVSALCIFVLLCSCFSGLAESWNCPSCGSFNSGNFCFNCGTKKPAGNSCPNCGAAFESGRNYSFCPECGANLNGAAAPQQNNTSMLSSSLLSGNIGDTVTFGHYEQNAYTGDGKEEIEWIILDVVGQKKLLISKYGLDCVMYNDEWIEVTWATSTIRKWLNSTFLNSAFSTDEQSYIQDTTIHTGDNISARTDGGSDTVDKVFFLSVDEANTYFGSDFERRLRPTEYAVARKCYVHAETSGCWWWLRTPGENQKQACMVMSSGLIRSESDYAYRDKPAIRPAIWVDLTGVQTSSAKTYSTIPVHVGGTYKFGKYDQNDYIMDGREAIEWVVLDIQGSNVLLMSVSVLECMPFDQVKATATWENCSLRSWLNGSFYVNAFSADEKGRILRTTITADGNTIYPTDQGRTTEDYVFLLSQYEAEHYLDSDYDRRSKPTPNLIDAGIYVNDIYQTCWWWLRTLGNTKYNVTSVNSDGSIDYKGGSPTSTRGGVRPCIWITFD